MFQRIKEKRAFSKALLERLRLNYREITWVNHDEFVYGKKKVKFERVTVGGTIIHPFQHGEFAFGVFVIFMSWIWLPIVLLYSACKGYRWTVNGTQMTLWHSIQLTNILRRIKRDNKRKEREKQRQEVVRRMNQSLADVGFDITEENKIK